MRKFLRTLFVNLALMLDPSVRMPAEGVVMGPVNDPALVVPFVLTHEFDEIARSQIGDAGSKVYIVLDQHGLPRCEANNQALMS